MGEKKYFEVVWLYWEKKSDEFVKKVHVSDIDGSQRRKRPVVRWKDRLRKELLIEGEWFNSKEEVFR